MPTVTFAGARSTSGAPLGVAELCPGPPSRAEITVDVTGPERLLDVCDEAGAPVAFSCRDGNCATCRVEVLAGIHLLEPAGAAEREVLDRLLAPATDRLACQAVVGTGEGTVRIRWGR